MGRHSTCCPAEVRGRALRLVFEHQGEYGSQWEAMCWIAAKFGCTAETLRRWVRQAERDSGARPRRSGTDAGGLLDDAGADLAQALAEGGELGPGERHPARLGIAQGEHQPVSCAIDLADRQLLLEVGHRTPCFA